jgi:hypothetical protein
MKKFYCIFTLSLFAFLFPGLDVFSQNQPNPKSPPPNFAPVAGDIHDVRGLWIPDYMKYLWWALIIIAVLIVVGLLVWWFVRYLKSRQPVHTLYQIVMERLQQCRVLILDGNARQFSGSVSDTVRDYLERRFAVPITHQTTEEFIRTATQKANNELRPYLPQLKDFLSYCDMAKFARSELDVAQMQLMLESAMRFVESTKPVEDKPEPQAANGEATTREATV